MENIYKGILFIERINLYSVYDKLTKKELSLLREYFEWDALLLDIEYSLSY